MLHNLFVQSFDSANHTRATTDAAVELAKQVGPVWFFAILCFVACIVLILGLGWIAYKFGGKFLERLEKFLDNLGTALVSNSEAIKAQATLVSHTRSNVSNLVDAGHGFANIAGKFGEEFGVDVSDDVDKIHDKLRNLER